MAYPEGMGIPHGQTDYGGAEAPRSKAGQHIDSFKCSDGYSQGPADGIGSLLRLYLPKVKMQSSPENLRFILHSSFMVP